MIESRAGGVLMAVALSTLALLLVLVAPPHRRPGFIVVAACLVAASLYAGLKGWSLQSIAPSSAAGDASQFIAKKQLVLGRPGKPWSRVWIDRELHSLLDSDV